MEAAIKQRKKKLNRKQFLTLVIMLCIMLFMLISFAWFYFKTDKEVDSEQADIMAPYYLYLLDEDGKSLSLTIGSFHPGETKSVVIGVSNKPAEDNTADYLVGKDSQFEYKMALAYTQNLPVEYRVYELTKTDEDNKEYSVEDPLSGEIIYLEKYLIEKSVEESNALTQENNQEMYGDEADSVVNYVQYDLYLQDSARENLALKTEVKGVTTSYEMDYYLIEMEWKEGIVFQDFIKETDLVYVIVNAVQPEPAVEEE